MFIENSSLKFDSRPQENKTVNEKRKKMCFSLLKRFPYLFQNSFQKKYRFIEFLGKGGFGTVFKVQKLDDLGGDNSIIALKVLEKNKFKNANYVDFLKNEAKIHKQLKHPFITESKGVFESKSRFFIELEYMEGGNLFKYIKENKIKEEEASIIIKRILTAVHYLHKNKIIHRDIKPQNILLEEKGNPTSAKLADFGLSVQYKNVQDCGFSTVCGTNLYMAPEQIEGRVYSKHVDIWAIGVTLFQTLSQRMHPYIDNESLKNGKRHEILEKMKEGELQENFIKVEGEKNFLVDFLQRVLEKNYFRRYSAFEALEHPWITRNFSAQIPLKFDEMREIFHIRRHLKKIFFVLVIKEKLIEKPKKKKRKNDDEQERKMESFLGKKFKIMNNKFRNSELINYSKKEYHKMKRRPSLEVKKKSSPKLTEFEHNLISVFKNRVKNNFSSKKKPCTVQSAKKEIGYLTPLLKSKLKKNSQRISKARTSRAFSLKKRKLQNDMMTITNFDKLIKHFKQQNFCWIKTLPDMNEKKSKKKLKVFSSAKKQRKVKRLITLSAKKNQNTTPVNFKKKRGYCTTSKKNRSYFKTNLKNDNLRCSRVLDFSESCERNANNYIIKRSGANKKLNMDRGKENSPFDHEKLKAKKEFRLKEFFNRIKI